ncbi:MAG: carbamoyl-phosphate synthase large subunit [Gracilimonas sp.]|uniref:Carbamoyl-phosphate synthase large subunit n=1 Tax=Gracilimonas sediminicola TaxID=2952158 RepID=A0A9X2L402_9BACT|nr:MULTISPECIES: carbamoyl-phosphate synthase large subunit [Gracilimonas]MBO6584952.1 carbamoyl-phosphate synthase large subunit [Gracilimonas sp.]MBO6615777.1 carbamoyl-phosphate synthase large subunit [Gracilimonas sp.]MCP9291393.1 carbamoyl-phosphate synthase large subunit [Gracilimonas sediminicola]
MPRRDDINKILIIGSGPIVIGQACEFDYSGSQACRSLQEEGYEIVLINSNPATIMTDPIMADAVYMLPMTTDSIREIVAKEKPDAVLPTMGGQTGLNLCRDLEKENFWKDNNIHIIGVDIDAVELTEDRQLFRDKMEEIGIEQCRSRTAQSLLDAKEIVEELGGLPIVIRPSFTMGGAGGGIVWNEDEFERKVLRGLELSPVHQVLIEESIFGWKEYELELLRDANDNVIIICSIENMDPMGVHTGDSVTVAPTQTLTDKQLQHMRDSAIKMMRSIGTFAGGCNVQFAMEPGSDRLVAIEINPRVSRSSALASKATGYPIAKVATKLAVGYTLDELKNQITGTTSACFEPSIDYVVCKIPRFNFDKFPGVDEELTTQMKAVGEVMSIGRNFPEALNKAWQSLEVGRDGLGADGYEEFDRKTVRERLLKPYWDRSMQIRNAFKMGASVEEIADITKVDPWFLQQIRYMVSLENRTEGQALKEISKDDFFELKQAGFSDSQIAFLLSKSGEKVDDKKVRDRRKELGITPSFKMVDTCAAEFPAQTPYYYSAYEGENESEVTDKKKVLILGSGPNRIGQGIEFDYSCTHAVLAAKEMGYEAIMVNCNPETVSTDFDFADKLYFEPVYWERVLDIIDHEKPEGVILQVGGQTALKLGKRFVEEGIKIFGTDFGMIDFAEDRGEFSKFLKKLDIPFPEYGTAREVEEAVKIAGRIGYPVLIRPSYVLGGQGMRIAVKEEELRKYVANILKTHPENAFLIDKYLEQAVEVDVDSVYDGDQLHIAGIMQHIEPAGVHSGDSTAVLPPYSLSDEVIKTIEEYQEKIAENMEILGFLNVQYAVKDDKVYVLEANPRTTRTIPFLAKATQRPEAAIGVKVMLGAKLKEFDLESKLENWAIKEPVFPFDKFPEVKKELGPEMKSTGESIYFAKDFNDDHFKKPYEFKSLYLSK